MILLTFRSRFTFISLFLLVGFCYNVQAQEEYEEWKENYLQEFQEFQNEYDKEFYETLKKEWENFKSENSPDFYEKPKPKKIPFAKKSESRDPKPQETKENEDTNTDAKQENAGQETERNNLTQDEDDVTITTSNLKQKEEDTQAEAPTSTPSAESIDFSRGISPEFAPNIKEAKVRSKQLEYFGIPINYKYYAAYEKKLDGKINQETIADFWKHLSTKEYPSFLEQIQQVRTQLSLNDYGYAQLLNNIGDQIYGKGAKESILFTWFMLTQSDFGTKIAYKNQNVYLLVQATPHVFQKSATIGGTRYYNLKLNNNHPILSSNFYTYQGDHGSKEKQSLNLLFDTFPTLPQQQEQRDLQFTFRDSTYSISVPVDMQAVDYFKDYPQADLDLYFNSQIAGDTHTQLVNALQPLLEDRPTLEQANLLLRFTQRSFEYQTDTEQFDTEKKMFPVETIYYPASDCDDRAIMFGYLLDQLTDLDYLVIRYPRHLTIAVHFPTDQEPSGNRINDPIIYNGKRYYVSDPTYFGADAGMIMPQYQDTKPSEIFDL